MGSVMKSWVGDEHGRRVSDGRASVYDGDLAQISRDYCIIGEFTVNMPLEFSIGRRSPAPAPSAFLLLWDGHAVESVGTSCDRQFTLKLPSMWCVNRCEALAEVARFRGCISGSLAPGKGSVSRFTLRPLVRLLVFCFLPEWKVVPGSDIYPEREDVVWQRMRRRGPLPVRGGSLQGPTELCCQRPVGFSWTAASNKHIDKHRSLVRGVFFRTFYSCNSDGYTSSGRLALVVVFGYWDLLPVECICLRRSHAVLPWPTPVPNDWRQGSCRCLLRFSLHNQTTPGQLCAEAGFQSVTKPTSVMPLTFQVLLSERVELCLAPSVR